MRSSLILATIAGICISLICVGEAFGYLDPIPRFHGAGLLWAMGGVVLFGTISFTIFSNRPFSFGYAVAFYFFCVVLGFLWIVPFSHLGYDHGLAFASALLSGLGFIWTATYAPLRLPRVTLPLAVVGMLPYAFLLIALVTIAAGARYNFHMLALSDIYTVRNDLDFPAPIRYATGIVLSALLPFACAAFIELRRYALAAVALALMAAFYPITLTKFSIFAPFWIVFLIALSRFVTDLRTVVILSILLPLTVGIVSLIPYMATHQPVYHVFGLINFRMIAIPSISLDIYSAFFTIHPHTHFCQINVVRAVTGCPYGQQLGLEIAKDYSLGSFNASLFSTEGIASVGSIGAPFVAILCGLVIAVGSAMASQLPPRFVLLSSGIALQQLINVPLSTALLSHGLALLFLLWYVTPRAALTKADERPALGRKPVTLTPVNPAKSKSEYAAHTGEASSGRHG